MAGWCLGVCWAILAWARPAQNVAPLPLLAWQQVTLFRPPADRDPQVDRKVTTYLDRLQQQGRQKQRQGVWLQSVWGPWVDYQGDRLLPAASLTKVATSFAALKTWGVHHRFSTKLYYQGQLEQGVLRGDLWLVADGDPLFVWEEAIALGQALERAGIRQVTGKLQVVGPFYMNYRHDTPTSLPLLVQAWQQKQWTPAITLAYEDLPQKNPPPRITLGGTAIAPALPADVTPLLRHQSLTLGQILQEMNIYSNNEVAQMLADGLGGASRVRTIAIGQGGLSPEEIQLVNGSGLGEANRLTPRAVCRLFRAIDKTLAPDALQTSDLFPVAGRDRHGTLLERKLPSGVAIKTGTLNEVSALGGIIPTATYGPLCFVVMNGGPNFEAFRREQDRFLGELTHHWTLSPQRALQPHQPRSRFGSGDRIQPLTP